jgi:hypothetical protein
MKLTRMMPTILVLTGGVGLAFLLWDAAHGMDSLADLVARRGTGQDI